MPIIKNEETFLSFINQESQSGVKEIISNLKILINEMVKYLKLMLRLK